MSNYQEALRDISVTDHHGKISGDITATIPGWKSQQDKAKNLIEQFIKIEGHPASYADLIFAWYAKAPEKWSFANGEIRTVKHPVHGESIRICCEKETKPNKFVGDLRYFPISFLAEATNG
jgi:hypothetical protein